MKAGKQEGKLYQEGRQWNCADDCVPKWSLGTRDEGRPTPRPPSYGGGYEAKLDMQSFR
jgi:hypothetical protein